MRALKLVQHMKTNEERMTEAVNRRIKSSDRCSELLQKVPSEELRQYSLAIYRDLTDWLATETDEGIEERYIGLGMRRAHQGVPFRNLFWAVCIAHEYLWEHIQEECLIEEPVEFWGGVGLLRSLTQFFDRCLYFTLIGYEAAGKRELANMPSAFAQR